MNNQEFLDELADKISLIFHPFLVPFPLILIYLSVAGTPFRESLIWTSIIFSTVTLPLVSFLWLKKGYGIRDVKDAEKRNILYAIAGIEILLLISLLLHLEAPKVLLEFIPAILSSLVAAAAINRFTKISVHVGVMSGFSAAYLLISAPLGVSIILLTGSVGWSRLRLGKHSFHQIMLGFTVPFLIFYLILGL